MDDGCIIEAHFLTEMQNGKQTGYIENRVDDVKRVLTRMPYHPIIEDDFEYAKSGRTYSDRSVTDVRRVVVRAIYTASDIDEEFDPQEVKSRLEDYLSVQDEFERVVINEPSTL